MEGGSGEPMSLRPRELSQYSFSLRKPERGVSRLVCFLGGYPIAGLDDNRDPKTDQHVDNLLYDNPSCLQLALSLIYLLCLGFGVSTK